MLGGLLGPAGTRNQGERVVAGQHLTQAASDIFLGWRRRTSTASTVTTTSASCGTGSPRRSTDAPLEERQYRTARRTLAQAHARSGDRVALPAYLGGSDTFARAVAEFAEAYSNQTERDFEVFQTAARSWGRAEAIMGTRPASDRPRPGWAPRSPRRRQPSTPSQSRSALSCAASLKARNPATTASTSSTAIVASTRRTS